MGIIKKILRKTASSYGYQLLSKEKYEPIDLTGEKFKSIWELVYLASGRDFIISVPLEDCRFFGITASIPTNKSANPFIKALMEHFELGITEYQESNLANFYANHQPKNIRERLELNISNSEYSSFKPAGLVLPWHSNSFDFYYKQTYLHEVAEGKQYNKKMKEHDGTKYFGPISSRKGQLEFDRLTKLFKKIKNEGYKKSVEKNGNVSADVLIDKERLAYVIKGGQHRVAVAAALGITEIPIKISPASLYDRKHLSCMPAVRRCYYTTEEAGVIFDRIFKGEQVSLIQDDTLT